MDLPKTTNFKIFILLINLYQIFRNMLYPFWGWWPFWQKECWFYKNKKVNKTNAKVSPDAIAFAIAFAAGPAVFDLDDAKALYEPAGAVVAEHDIWL